MNHHSWKKRFAQIIVLLLLGILPLFGPAMAGPAVGPGQGQPASLVVSAQDHGQQIRLAADQVLAVRLEANPSTGYVWEVAEVDGQVLRQVGPMEFEPDSELLGAPGTVTLRFQAAAAGKTRLGLVYRRPWEGIARDTFALEVTAQGASSMVSQPSDPSPADLPAASEQPQASPQAAAPAALPSAFNWCDEVDCTPVKNQAACGSCWAFATVGTLELGIKISDGVTQDLSEQYLVSCNTEGWGCNGGWWAHDYHEWKIPPGESDAGAVYEADFPYAASDVDCNPPHDHYEKIASWNLVNPNVNIPTLGELKQALYDHGPLGVAICAGPALSGYDGGIFAIDESYRCYGGVNHAVVLVGWDDTEGVWYMRNSWSSGWGEGGYARIAYGTSNIGWQATYVTYESTRPPLAPDNLWVQVALQTWVRLAWDDASGNESGFRIERSPNGHDPWLEVDTVGPNVTTYTDTGLTMTTTYYYRVHAYNDNGDSAYSNVVQADTIAPFTEAVYLPSVIRGQ